MNTETTNRSTEEDYDRSKFSHSGQLVLFLFPQNQERYDEEVLPIIMMKYAKNRLSHYRGEDGLKFSRHTSQLAEVRG